MHELELYKLRVLYVHVEEDLFPKCVLKIILKRQHFLILIVILGVRCWLSFYTALVSVTWSTYTKLEGYIIKHYRTVFRHGANFDEATKDPRYILKQLPGVFHADEPLPIPPGMDYCPYARNYLCDAKTQYRSYDGSCNNLERPLWGRSMIPYNRYLPAHYGDSELKWKIPFCKSAYILAAIQIILMVPSYKLSVSL